MVVARQASTVVITTAQDLDRLRESFDELGGEHLILDLNPDGDPVLSTAAEFRALAASAIAAGVSLTISTDDPVRQELARFSGLRVDGGWRNVTTASRFAADEVTVVSKQREKLESDAAADDPVVEDSAELVKEAATQGSFSGPKLERLDPFDTNASFSFVITPPVPRRPDVSVAQDAQPWVATTTRPAARQRRRRTATSLVVIAVIALIAIIGALLVGVIAPYAKVRLVPATQPVTASITYGLAGSGENLDVAIEPQTIRTTVSYETTVSTTGERFEPDAAASGSVNFTNPTTQEIVVPAGTELTIPDTGITFTTASDVVIPAADPFGSMTFGSASVEAVAVQAGTDGNVDAGAITGQLDSGVFYTNRDSMSGGTVKRIPVVAEADLQTARADAEAAITQQVASAIQGEIPAGQELVDGSVSTGTPDIQLDRIAGQDAESLAVTASMVVEAQVYDPDALHQAGSDALSERLAEGVPSGFELQPDSLEVGEPLAQGGAFVITGTSSARAILTPEQLDRLNAELVGADEEAARQAVSAVPGVESYDIQFGPDWLPVAPVPRLESRIEVDVEQEAEQASESAGQTGP